MHAVTPIVMTAGRPALAVRQASRLSDCFSNVILANGGSLNALSSALAQDDVRQMSGAITICSEPDFVLRFIRATQMVDSEFVAMLPDDDVTVPSTLQAISALMTDHPESAIGTGRWWTARAEGRQVHLGNSLGGEGSVAPRVAAPMPDLSQWQFRPELYWGVYRTRIAADLFNRAALARSEFADACPRMSRISTWRMFELTVVLMCQARFATIEVEEPILIKDEARTLASRFDRWCGFLELESMLSSCQVPQALERWRQALQHEEAHESSLLDAEQTDWAEAALLRWATDGRGRPRLRSLFAPAIRTSARALSPLTGKIP